jgi:hypothetical protein
MDKAKQAVHDALVEYGWTVDKEESGETSAHLKQDKLMARIHVEYSKTQATVRYVDSENFNYSKSPNGEEHIHSHYLLWAQNIANAINKRLNGGAQ